jgi:elongation factor G
MADLIKLGKPVLLEPFMNLTLEIPADILGDTLTDITANRGGKIIEINNVKAKFSDEVDMDKRIINGLIPLSQVVGYSKFIRMNSHGQGKFILSFSHFEAISADKAKEVMENQFF